MKKTLASILGMLLILSCVPNDQLEEINDNPIESSHLLSEVQLVFFALNKQDNNQACERGLQYPIDIDVWDPQNGILNTHSIQSPGQISILQESITGVEIGLQYPIRYIDDNGVQVINNRIAFEQAITDLSLFCAPACLPAGVGLMLNEVPNMEFQSVDFSFYYLSINGQPTQVAACLGHSNYLIETYDSFTDMVNSANPRADLIVSGSTLQPGVMYVRIKDQQNNVDYFNRCILTINP